MRLVAQDWCTGMTLKDGMGREVGGGHRVMVHRVSKTESDMTGHTLLL